MIDFRITLVSWGLALIWDQLFGEYPNRWHPVVWMGWFIKRGEHLFLGRGRRWESLGGLLMALLIPCGFAGLTWYSLQILAAHPFWQLLLGVFWFKASFALNALGGAAQGVSRCLEAQDILGARKQLQSLCSRDGSQLSEEEITEAAISSLAENLSDSVIAPWLWAAVAGIPGAIFYRAVNTLDAMIGYKNQYRFLGYFSARIDDFLNLLPARLTAILLLIAGSLQRLHPQRRSQPSSSTVWSIVWRDHAKTPSPNGGWPMATMAGLLGITLRKVPLYELGDRHRSSELSLMTEAWQLTQIAAWLGSLLSIIIFSLCWGRS